jgi:hypothetical protein
MVCVTHHNWWSLQGWLPFVGQMDTNWFDTLPSTLDIYSLKTATSSISIHLSFDQTLVGLLPCSISTQPICVSLEMSPVPTINKVHPSVPLNTRPLGCRKLMVRICINTSPLGFRSNSWLGVACVTYNAPQYQCVCHRLLHDQCCLMVQNLSKDPYVQRYRSFVC